MLDTIYGEQALENVMKSGTQTFVILHDSNGPQGFASYGLRGEDSSVCKLHKIYVLPENQGKGYGKILLEEVKIRAINMNADKIDLNVNRFNTAISFYEKLGFKKIKVEDVAIGPYFMNDYVMRLNLSNSGL
jgi:ribosomal protein S18 acetylase RimI-like enzyme